MLQHEATKTTQRVLGGPNGFLIPMFGRCLLSVTLKNTIISVIMMHIMYHSIYKSSQQKEKCYPLNVPCIFSYPKNIQAATHSMQVQKDPFSKGLAAMKKHAILSARKHETRAKGIHQAS